MGNEIAANKPENPSYPQDVVDKTSRTVDKCITCNKVVTLLVAVAPGSWLLVVGKYKNQ
jgi:hypothetical protein